jgi:Domain of unknown function (DUF2703)
MWGKGARRTRPSARRDEDWLNASVGKSRCCSVCGDADCRTVEIDGSTFEAIPERVIASAGLAAAGQMLRDAQLPLGVGHLAPHTSSVATCAASIVSKRPMVVMGERPAGSSSRT